MKRKIEKGQRPSDLIDLPENAAGTMFDLRLEDSKIKEIVACFIEDPRITVKMVAEKVKLPEHKVYRLCRDNNYLKALMTLARRRVTMMVPLALESLKKSMEEGSDDVRFKGAVKVLESEGVIGPSKVDVTINDIRELPMEKLNQIIENGKNLPSQVIEGEMIS